MHVAYSYYLSLLTFPMCFFPSFFRLTFSSISSSISYLPEYGPAPFPGRRSQEATESGFSLFVFMFAVFLAKDACVFFVPVGLVFSERERKRT